MDCPVCREAMISLELDEVEIDHCLACGGIWLDAGELELLIGDEQRVRAIWDTLRGAPHSPETPRRCPICRKRMEKVLVGEDAGHEVLIDRCVRRHGLWFDRGELDAVLSRARLDPDHRVRHFLGKMFCDKGDD